MRFPKDNLHALLDSAPVNVTCTSRQEAHRLRHALYRARGEREVVLGIDGPTVQIRKRTPIVIGESNE